MHNLLLFLGGLRDFLILYIPSHRKRKDKSYGRANPAPTVIMQHKWQNSQHTKVTNPAFVEFSALQISDLRKKDDFCMFMQTNKRHKQKTRSACAHVQPAVCTRSAEFLQTLYYRLY